MAEQDDLQLAGQAFAAMADTESARFARDLARVLAALERDLLGLVSGVRDGQTGLVTRAARLLQLRAEIRRALERAGYTTLVARASVDVVSRMARAAQSNAATRAAAALGRVSDARLNAIAGLMRADLLGVGEPLAYQLWRTALLALYTNTSQQTLVASIAKVLDQTRAQAQTVFDTQVSVVQRAIVAAEPQDGETQAYLYVGPTDGKVRDWCLAHLGLVLTRAQIDALDNGQLPNVFLTGGGYNCRHTWMAVSDPELVALADTGMRAPGFAERLATARAARAALRANRRRAA